MIARPVNRIAEEKGGGKSVREIDKEGSCLCGRVQGGTESLYFSTGIAALRGHTAEERYNLCESELKKEIPIENAERRLWVKTYPLCPKARTGEAGAERARHVLRLHFLLRR